MAGILIKEFNREVLIAWLYVAMVTVAGVFSMAVADSDSEVASLLSEVNYTPLKNG